MVLAGYLPNKLLLDLHGEFVEVSLQFEIVQLFASLAIKYVMSLCLSFVGASIRKEATSERSSMEDNPVYVPKALVPGEIFNNADLNRVSFFEEATSFWSRKWVRKATHLILLVMMKIWMFLICMVVSHFIVLLRVQKFCG